ncbi:MAG: response regulator transcription factor [Bacteroidota bacterium]
MDVRERVREKKAAAERRPVRVLVVDDHPAIRDAIKEAVNTTIDVQVVGEAGSAREALQALDKQQPDVAIVDLSLKDGHGLNLIQSIRSQYSGVRVIVFSMHDENVYAERAIRAGAHGYLMKCESVQTIVDAIRSVRQGDIYLSRRMATKILGSVSTGRTASSCFPVDELTEREMTVFQMLGQGYTVEDIMQSLKISRKTVETHRRRIKEKFDLGTVGEVLQFAVQWTHAEQNGLAG